MGATINYEPTLNNRITVAEQTAIEATALNWFFLDSADVKTQMQEYNQSKAVIPLAFILEEKWS